jgi:hypothetical protein
MESNSSTTSVRIVKSHMTAENSIWLKVSEPTRIYVLCIRLESW